MKGAIIDVTAQAVDHNGCDTRDDILRRDLTNVVFRAGSSCVVARGTLHDPYTGKTIGFVRGVGTSTAVQIDHVVALADAWRTGLRQLDGRPPARLRQQPVGAARCRRPGERGERRQ